MAEETLGGGQCGYLEKHLSLSLSLLSWPCQPISKDTLSLVFCFWVGIGGDLTLSLNMTTMIRCTDEKCPTAQVERILGKADTVCVKVRLQAREQVSILEVSTSFFLARCQLTCINLSRSFV